MRCLKLLWITSIAAVIFLPSLAFACSPLHSGDAFFCKDMGFPSDEVTALACDQQGNVFVGTEDRGLIVISAGGVGWREISMEDSGLGVAIHSLFVDPQGTLWIGTTGGLLSTSASQAAKMNGLPGGQFLTAQGLPDNICLSMAQTPFDSRFLVGTTMGVVEKGPGYQRFTEKDGIPSNLIQALVADSDGKIWLGTSQGLAMGTSGKYSRIQLDPKNPEIIPWVFALGSMPQNNKDKVSEKAFQKYLEKVGATIAAFDKGMSERPGFGERQGLPSEFAYVQKEMTRLCDKSSLYVATNEGLFAIRRSDLSVDCLASGWYTAIALDKFGQTFAADTELIVKTAEPTTGFSFSYDVSQMIRAHLSNQVLRARFALARRAVGDDAASLSAGLIELAEKPQEEFNRWLGKLLDQKRISSMVFNPSTGHLWVGVKGAGLFRFLPILTNTDSFTLTLLGYNRDHPDESPPAQGFRLSPASWASLGKIGKKTPEIGVGWGGRWSELSFDDAVHIGYLMGRYGPLGCMGKLARALPYNPFVEIPVGEL
ncbi:MAG: two-component regulator propeller domain-containing protein [Candidatus Ozemobacteraceae bacterium]